MLKLVNTKQKFYAVLLLLYALSGSIVQAESGLSQSLVTNLVDLPNQRKFPVVISEYQANYKITVFNKDGILIGILHDGPLAVGTHIFGFIAPPGIYTIIRTDAVGRVKIERKLYQ